MIPRRGCRRDSRFRWRPLTRAIPMAKIISPRVEFPVANRAGTSPQEEGVALNSRLSPSISPGAPVSPNVPSCFPAATATRRPCFASERATRSISRIFHKRNARDCRPSVWVWSEGVNQGPCNLFGCSGFVDFLFGECIGSGGFLSGFDLRRRFPVRAWMSCVPRL